MQSIKYGFSVFLFLPFMCFAFSLQHEAIPVQLGMFFPSKGKAQDINIQGLIGNQYTVNNPQTGNGFFGVGYYVPGLDNEYVHLSYGVNGFYFGTNTVIGSIVQEHLFTNLAYSYHVRNISIYLAGKGIVKNSNPKYNFTFDAGIGPNFIRTSHYLETSLDDFSIPANSFAPHSNVAFSAMAGVGVRLNNMFGKAPLECGYRFFYLGQGRLSINNDQIINTLKTGNNYANAIMCSVAV